MNDLIMPNMIFGHLGWLFGHLPRLNYGCKIEHLQHCTLIKQQFNIQLFRLSHGIRATTLTFKVIHFDYFLHLSLPSSSSVKPLHLFDKWATLLQLKPTTTHSYSLISTYIAKPHMRFCRSDNHEKKKKPTPDTSISKGVRGSVRAIFLQIYYQTNRGRFFHNWNRCTPPRVSFSTYSGVVFCSVV